MRICTHGGYVMLWHCFAQGPWADQANALIAVVENREGAVSYVPGNSIRFMSDADIAEYENRAQGADMYGKYRWAQERISRSVTEPRPAPGVHFTAGEPERRVAVVRVQWGDRYLLLQRRGEPFDGQWCGPGGGIKSGETAIMAAYRELMEETGVMLDSPDMLTEIPQPPLTQLRKENPEVVKHRENFVFYVFHAEIHEAPTIKLEDEFQGYGWFTLEQVKLMNTMYPL